jgi:hypothetical protein
MARGVLPGELHGWTLDQVALHRDQFLRQQGVSGGRQA